MLSKVIRRQFFHYGNRCANSIFHSVDTGVSPDLPKSLPPFSKEDYEVMMAHFPRIVDDLTTIGEYSRLPHFTKRFARLLHYTVPNGKKVRGLATIITYRMLETPGNITEEGLKLASILAWCVELLEASILILDDIIDRSDVRRNATCWYKMQDVGNLAILDAVTLENGAHLLLKKYFSSHPHYIDMVELFTSTNFAVNVGQLLDSTEYELAQISMDLYSIITKYKTGTYTFEFAVALGMYLSKVYEEDLYQEIRPILLALAEYFQIMNDYNDCFGDPAVTGKTGTDIQEGKCTWLAARALQKVNSTQYDLMAKHYGNPTAESVKAIVKLYEELNLPQEIKDYEQQSFKKLCRLIGKIPQKSVVNLLFTLVEKTYKRDRV